MIRVLALKRTSLMAMVLAASMSPALAQDMTVVTYGGSSEVNIKKAWVDPFTEQSGIPVAMDTYGGELAKIRAMVESGNVVWDLLDMEAGANQAACDQGLLEKIGENPVFGTLGLVEGALTECGVGQATYATILTYNKDAFKEPPTQVTDIFDTVKFPGKRGLRKTPSETLLIALVADGVAPADVQKVLATPEGVDRAFKKLDTIKSDIVWWDSGPQPVQRIKSGEVVMTTVWNARLAVANAEEAADLPMIWPNHVQAIGLWGVPKGTRHLKSVTDFLVFTLKPEVNAAYSHLQPYGPVVEKANEFVKKEVYPNLPNAHINEGAVVQDPVFWSRYGEGLEARFSSWLSQ